MDAEFTSNIKTTFLILQRKELAYLRFAEALVGLARTEEYEGAMELAMTVLKVGVKSNYRLLKNPVYAIDTTFVEHKDTLGNILKVDTLMSKPYLVSCTDSIVYNFTAAEFETNEGIHSRGSGYSERNEYYALNDKCIARYLGRTIVDDSIYGAPINYQD
jgi:hypothetical protein